MGFNNEQLSAITAPISKNVLVAAGAGSGKTRTLAEKVFTIIDEGEQIKYTVNMYSDNYQLIKRILCGLAVIAALPLIALVIYSINKNYENGYDERQLKAQGVAYMNAFFVTLFTAIVLGMVSMIMDDLPLTIYESSLITFMIGFATFVISADVKDAYFGFRKKRLPLAIVFGIVGIISLIVAVIGFANGLAGRSGGRCCMLYSCEHRDDHQDHT